MSDIKGQNAEAMESFSSASEGLNANIALTSSIEVPVIDNVIEKRLNQVTKAYATGRRKEAVAKLWLEIDRTEKFDLAKLYKNVSEYFKNETLCFNVFKSLSLLNETQHFAFGFKLKFRLVGGGRRGQSDAMRLAFSKALMLLFPDLRPILRRAELLTSDGRQKEREHPGFRTSRKPQQYSRR